MAGGQELAELSHELRAADPGKVVTPHAVEHGGVAAPDPGAPSVRRRDLTRSSRLPTPCPPGRGGETAPGVPDERGVPHVHDSACAHAGGAAAARR